MSEVFLGMANQLGKFSEKLREVSQKLRDLVRTKYQVVLW